MEGPNSRRYFRLISYLATHPHRLLQYVRFSPFFNASPLKAELPWIEWRALETIAKHLTSDKVIFDWGSGGSTLFFARKAHEVFGVEDNPAWYDLVQQTLTKNGISNVNLKLCGADYSTTEALLESEYCKAMPNLTFDIVLVDGTEGSPTARTECFKLSEQKVKPGGMIVVDDSWRHQDIRSLHKAKALKTFQGTGPCRFGITSTDIFFY